MAHVDYLLHESALGYAVFSVSYQADSVGLRLKEVQDSLKVPAQPIGNQAYSSSLTDFDIGPLEIWQDGQAGEFLAMEV